jgi:hypothetical protein
MEHIVCYQYYLPQLNAFCSITNLEKYVYYFVPICVLKIKVNKYIYPKRQDLKEGNGFKNFGIFKQQ